jgi:prevent-host-death family protein
MELVQHIRKTELARNTRQVIRAAQRGQTVVVESHGQPEVAIMDITDFYIVRAVLRCYAESSADIGDAEWDEQAWQTAVTPQARFDLVLAHYLNEHISLGKAAELLELAWLDLRTRLVRLNVPLRIGPVNLDEARQDVANLTTLLASNNP